MKYLFKDCKEYKYMNYDYERKQIYEAIQQLLIEYQYKITNCFIDEQTYSTNYTIETNTITVDLIIIFYSENINNVFDEIVIYNHNDILFEVTYEDMPDIFCKDKIIQLLKTKITNEI